MITTAQQRVHARSAVVDTFTSREVSAELGWAVSNSKLAPTIRSVVSGLASEDASEILLTASLPPVVVAVLPGRLVDARFSAGEEQTAAHVSF